MAAVAWRSSGLLRRSIVHGGGSSKTVQAALAGVEPKDISADITPQDVVIKAETAHTHSETEGQVHRCEFTAGQLFRSVLLRGSESFDSFSWSSGHSRPRRSCPVNEREPR